MQPLLSICIPTWNRAETLRKCLESLRLSLAGVPASDVEVCVSDNSSTDGTPKVLNDFRASGFGIQFACLPEHAAFGTNYWNAANLASGKFIFVTGDDDEFLPAQFKAFCDRLRDFTGDLLLLNNSPWRSSNRELPDQRIASFENYAGLLGLFHASFIGNAVFRRELLTSVLHSERATTSLYPHMVPIFRALLSSHCLFWNIQFLTVDDSLRPWKPRQPLLTSIDMARLVADNVFRKSQCSLECRVRVHIFLMRSLPKAVVRDAMGIVPASAENPYQSLSLRNISRIYGSVPLLAPAACLLAVAARLGTRLRSLPKH